MPTSPLGASHSFTPVRLERTELGIGSPVGREKPSPDNKPSDSFLPNSPTYEELLAENRKLRGKVDQLQQERSEVGPIQIDPSRDRLTVTNFKTPDFEVEKLQVGVSDLNRLLGDTLSLDKLLESRGGELPLPPFDELQDTPITVGELKLRIPGKTLKASALKLGEDTLEKNGLRDLSIEARPGDRLKLSGKVDRLIGIPFEVNGKLSVDSENRVQFKLEKSRVFGVVPVPRIVVSIAAALGGKDMADLGVEQRGDTFTFDPGTFLPKNVRLKLTRVGTDRGALVVEGKAPDPPAEPPRNPTTLVDFGP